MRLLIVSHVIHYEHDGRLWAYGPYSTEIDLWADLFREVVIASPVRREKPPGDCAAFDRANITMLPQPEVGGETAGAKLKMLATLPVILFDLARAISRADAVHARLPGNLGTFGAFLAPLFGRRMVAKYAGIWGDSPEDTLSIRVQRGLLRHWFRGPVTVYGEWPNEPAHITPFFTSLMTEQQMDRARRAVADRQPSPTLRVLYTGRLTPQKNIDVMIEAAGMAAAEGVDIACTVVGVGPERERLEDLSRRLGIADRVTFTGGVGFDRVLDCLEQSDVLVLTSDAEGWGKSVAEAMAFGLVCVGSSLGFSPKMLADGRGLTVMPRDAKALAGIFSDIARNPDQYNEMRVRAAEWAQRFTLEGLQEAIRQLLEKSWAVQLPLVRAPQVRG